MADPKFRSVANARSYVATCLEATIQNDLDSGAGYLFDDEEDLDEASRRRVVKAAEWWLAKLRRFQQRPVKP